VNMKAFNAWLGKVWAKIKVFFVALSTVIREGGKPGDPVSSRRVVALIVAILLAKLLLDVAKQLSSLTNPWPTLVLLGIPTVLILFLFYFTTLGDIKGMAKDIMDGLKKKDGP